MCTPDWVFKLHTLFHGNRGYRDSPYLDGVK